MEGAIYKIKLFEDCGGCWFSMTLYAFIVCHVKVLIFWSFTKKDVCTEDIRTLLFMKLL